jgi:hypothetical protein
MRETQQHRLDERLGGLTRADTAPRDERVLRLRRVGAHEHRSSRLQLSLITRFLEELGAGRLDRRLSLVDHSTGQLEQHRLGPRAKLAREDDVLVGGQRENDNAVLEIGDLELGPGSVRELERPVQDAPVTIVDDAFSLLAPRQGLDLDDDRQDHRAPARSVVDELR